MNTVWPGEWVEQALCAEADPETWFPVKGSSPAPAKSICRRCDVRAECLDYVISAPEPLAGVWGGLTEAERRPLRMQRQQRRLAA